MGAQLLRWVSKTRCPGLMEQTTCNGLCRTTFAGGYHDKQLHDGVIDAETVRTSLTQVLEGIYPTGYCRSGQ